MSSHTVLVVEDDEDLRETMREALALHGYAVVAAQDGQEALEALDHLDHVCMVLLDLWMPRMNGWDFLIQLRARPALADVPVIIHTSAPKQAPPGATRVLSKPLALERLLSVVREFCGS
jgi:chemotaxis family two-component system sensor histidine kinase/response regulator PixL